MPVNSQLSRTLDAIRACELLKEFTKIDSDEHVGIIGGSMGGDIAVHVLETITPGALLLRAPAAYPDAIHELPYGPEWGAEIRKLGGADAALTSSNFARLSESKIPQLLIYTGGETIIPKATQEKYISAVRASEGEFLRIGGSEIPHQFINYRLKPDLDTPTNKNARDQIYKASVEFFMKSL
jgi:dienelactone hydrolase